MKKIRSEEKLTFKIVLDETTLLFRIQMVISVFDAPFMEKINVNSIFGIQGNNQEILIEIFATFYNVLVEANDLFDGSYMKPFGHVVEIVWRPDQIIDAF